MIWLKIAIVVFGAFGFFYLGKLYMILLIRGTMKDSFQELLEVEYDLTEEQRKYYICGVADAFDVMSGGKDFREVAEASQQRREAEVKFK